MHLNSIITSSFSSLISAYELGYRIVSKNKLLVITAIAIGCLTIFNYRSYLTSFILPKTTLLCVLYDAGETGALVPVLKKLEIEGKDFRVLVMGTAETIVKPDMFKGKRLTLKDFQIDTIIDSTTSRTASLSKEMMNKFQKLNPKVVLVGTASKIQQQILEQFPASTTVAFVDNLSYDKQQESFSTVRKVQAVAKHVLIPSKHTLTIFADKAEGHRLKPEYHVVGKPSLEVWKEEIASANCSEILQKLNFKKEQPIVTFIGGYGPGYEVINPLFSQCGELLEKEGFQVIQQPHPKIAPQRVKTTEALAVSQYVVGYNSSVILDSAIEGVHALFFIPDDSKTQFNHFAIERGLVPRVSSCQELVEYIKAKRSFNPVGEVMGIPHGSVNNIIECLDRWM